MNDADLARRLAEAKDAAPLYSVWKHSRSGNVYLVRCVAVLEATLEVVIVYEKDGTTWVRPWSSWNELVQLGDGSSAPRFVRV